MINQAALDLGTERSCIRQLFEYGLGRAKIVGAENVYDFSLGNPSIPAPKEVKEALLALLEEESSLSLHGYTTAAGLYETRKAIAEDLNCRFSAAVRPEDLFITGGAAPALCAVLKALQTEHSEVIALCPYFPEYKPFAQMAGQTFVTVEAKLPDFSLPLEGLEKAIHKNTAAVILNSPNNPSGVVYSRENLEELAALLDRKANEIGHPIYLISDEPYRELVYEGTEVPFLPNIYRNTLICYSYSKCLSLPGERIGYVYVNQFADKAATLYAAVAGAARALGHVCAPSLMQKVIARCASVGPDLSAYDKNRKALYEGLKEMGYEMPKPLGAFYLLVKAPGGDAKAFSEAAKQLDLLIVPGDDFGIPGYFRLCYCVDYEKIIGSLPLFQKLICDE